MSLSELRGVISSAISSSPLGMMTSDALVGEMLGNRGLPLGEVREALRSMILDGTIVRGIMPGLITLSDTARSELSARAARDAMMMQ